MPRRIDPTEREAAKQALKEAILLDGEGKTYYTHTGLRLWEPNSETMMCYWNKGAYTCSMRSTEDQVVAYWRNDEVVVTHNGTERRKLSARGWY